MAACACGMCGSETHLWQPSNQQTATTSGMRASSWEHQLAVVQRFACCCFAHVHWHEKSASSSTKPCTICFFGFFKTGIVGMGGACACAAPYPAGVPTTLCSGVAACRDCWCVAFGNSHNDDERCVLAGYDNGDVKLFDLRTNKVRMPGGLLAAFSCSTQQTVAAQPWHHSSWRPVPALLISNWPAAGNYAVGCSGACHWFARL